ncbi:hypothetical protein ACWDBW_01145 [Streptomyces sp. NPDC001107]
METAEAHIMVGDSAVPLLAAYYSFGSPTIQHDLEVFDKQWGLPDTQVDVVKWGDVPAYDPTDPDARSSSSSRPASRRPRARWAFPRCRVPSTTWRRTPGATSSP